MTAFPRDLIAKAFPGQPRMQSAFEGLVTDAEALLGQLETTATALAQLQGDTANVTGILAGKQNKSDMLTALSLVGADPGVLEQVSPGIISVRQVDTADTASLMTRALADTRYLGGAHAAASATKLATARSITATADASWTVTFDGSANVSAALTLATVNSNTGTFGGAKTSPQFSVNGKGLVTGVTAVTITPDYSSIGIVPTSTFLGRVTAGTGSAEALTPTQATALLNVFSSTLKGLVPASGGGTTNFLRADGTWAAAGSTVTPAALTKTDDTNVTLTLGGTPATALLQAVSVTVGWAGQLAVTRGGTGLGSLAQGDLLYGSAANTITALAKNTTAQRVLTNGGTSNNPAWAQVDLTTGVTGVLPTANGGVPQAAFASFTPTWTNVTVGNGTVTAKYLQIGKLVLVRIVFTLGSTSAVSGDAKITLPVTAASATGNLLSLGRARFYDLSLDTAYDGDVHDTDTTHASFRINNTAGTYSTAAATGAAAPLPWATGDVLTAQFWYEAA